MTVTREVSVHGKLDDPRSVPIQAINNGDGTYSLAISGAGGIITTGPQVVSFNDHSGTIGTASVAQLLMTANSVRKSLYIQNISVSALYIKFGGGDAAESIILGSGSGKIIADGNFEMEGSSINQDSISIIGGTAGQEFVAWEGV